MPLIIRLLVACLTAVFVLGSIAAIAAESDSSQPEPVSDKGSSDNGKTDPVLELKKRIIETRNKGELGFGKVVACSKVEGFGRYSPLDPDRPLKNVVFYFEPANFSTLVTGDRYIVDCSLDIQGMTDTGKTLFLKRNALKINRVSRSPIIDLHFNVNVKFRKPPKKTLVIRLVLHDNIKNESVTTIYRFAPEKKEPKSIKDI